MNTPHMLLVTLDYPPHLGGVARYYGGLVRAMSPTLTTLTNIPGAISSSVIRRTLTWQLWPKWLPLLWVLPQVARQCGAQMVAVGQLLPVGTAAWLLRLAGGRPYVIFLHGYDIALSQRNTWKRWLTRHILSDARLIVANSTFTRQLAVAASADPTKTIIVYPAIEALSTNISVDELKQQHGLAGQTVLLSVARLVKRKGIDDVIAILPELTREIPNITYTVVGDGPERVRLEQLAHRLGVNVIFAGRATDAELAVWYQLCDLFVLVPKADPFDVEGFGIVYLEAQAAGKPVIGSRVGGVPEAVGGAGLVVTTSHELVSAIRRLLGDKELRRHLGQIGLTQVRDFTTERQAAILKEHLYAD